MNVVYREKAKQSGDYLLLQQATRYLDEIVGEPLDPVTAEWDGSPLAGKRASFTLSLSDFMGSASGTFTRDELTQPKPLRSRFRDLWGDLLQAHSNALVQRLLQLVKEGE
jgi:hypothetical protein